MSALRPLPPNPSLEFERKEAKALLRRLRAGDAEALARARERHPAIAAATPALIRLADAQLVLAREYGFTSWPRLVGYFEAVARQRHRWGGSHDGRTCEPMVRSLLEGHRSRRMTAGRALAAYVPRFYGMRPEEVFGSAVTEAEARLAVARQQGSPSWEVMLERSAEVERLQDEWRIEPLRLASEALKTADLEGLRQVVEAHPELLHPTETDAAVGRNLMRSALHHERSLGREAMRPITQWLEAQGFNAQLELNRQLCGRMRMETQEVRWLLEQGADPNWVAPNGIPVLEHALIRYWNGEAVDLIAARTVPRKALWIAAGLGDVDGVRGSLGRAGKPTRAARRLRPDFDAVGPWPMVPILEPDDEEVLMEAFFIAVLNGRTAVLEYMVSRGFPVNSLVWGSTIVAFAVGNGMTPVVECLVRCGADLDLRGSEPTARESARELAREMLENFWQAAERRRIAESCGLDPDAIVADLRARTAQPVVEPRLQEALELAGDDARRLGQSDIRPENLFFGLLRGQGPARYFVTQVSRMDVDRFRADVRDRVRAADDRVGGPPLPLHPDAQAAVQAAVRIASEGRRDEVTSSHLLLALLGAEHGPVAELLGRFGASVAGLRAALARD